MPFFTMSDAALRLYQACRSCVAQDFGWSEVGAAGLSVLSLRSLRQALLSSVLSSSSEVDLR